ncbi:MAG: type II secretion system protein GspG [Smithella sp.]
MKITKQAFFSTELAITIAVAIVLFIGIAYKGSEALQDGRTSKATASAASIGAVISEYKMEIGAYPESLDKLTVKNGSYGPWLSSIPRDPWGHAYIYQYSDDGYVIYSCGKSGHSHGSTVSAISKGDIGFIGR